MSPVPRLRWVDQPLSSDPDDVASQATVGAVVIGRVVPLKAGGYRWTVDGVQVRHIAKTHGTLQTLAACRRAVRRSWSAWWKETEL